MHVIILGCETTTFDSSMTLLPPAWSNRINIKDNPKCNINSSNRLLGRIAIHSYRWMSDVGLFLSKKMDLPQLVIADIIHILS